MSSVTALPSIHSRPAYKPSSRNPTRVTQEEKNSSETNQRVEQATLGLGTRVPQTPALNPPRFQLGHVPANYTQPLAAPRPQYGLSNPFASKPSRYASATDIRLEAQAFQEAQAYLGPRKVHVVKSTRAPQAAKVTHAWNESASSSSATAAAPARVKSTFSAPITVEDLDNDDF